MPPDENQNPPVIPPAGDPPAAALPGGNGEGGDPPKHVPYDTHRKLLDERKKVGSELDALRAKEAERERKEAEAKGEFQKLLENERAESARLKGKLEETEQQEAGRRKLAAILNGAGGNIDRKWFATIQSAGLIDSVIIDPNTGDVDSTSVAKAVEKLKTSFPEIIAPRGGPKVPNGDPKAGAGTGAGKILYADYVKLSFKEMKKWDRSQIVD